jgi:hypothetical protein
MHLFRQGFTRRDARAVACGEARYYRRPINELGESESDRGPADTIEFLELIFGRDRLARTVFSAHDFIADRLAQLVDKWDIAIPIQRSHRYVVITIQCMTV